MFEQAPQSMVLYDAEGRVLALNPAFERLWGARREDVPASYSVLNDPQLEAAGIMPHVRRAFRGETVSTPRIRYDLAAVGGKGRTLWTEGHFYPLIENGRLSHVVLTHRDVTAQVEAEAQLRDALADLESRNVELEATMLDLEEARESADEARGRIEAILDALSDTVVMYDREWRVRYLNPAARTIISSAGRDPDAAIGQVIWEFQPELLGTRFETETRRAVAEHRELEFEEYFAPLDRWFDNRILPGRDGTVTTFSRDITDRKRAAEVVRLGSERHRALTDASTLMMWTTTSEGTVEDMPFWRELTGQTAEEVRGNGWALAIHPADQARVGEAWWSAFNARAEYQAEYRLHMKDGSYRWFRARGVPIVNPDGSLREYVGVFNDIDDEKRSAIRREFLTEASRLLGSSLDYEETLRNIARAAVPDLADWCAIEMLDDPSDTSWPPKVTRLVVEHQDPAKVLWAKELEKRVQQDWNAPAGLPRVIRDGVTEFYPVITNEMIEAAARTPEELELLREINYSALIIVPLRIRGRVFGAVQLVMTESGRRYTDDDRVLAEALADRASAAIENARLLRAAEDSAERTSRLQAVTAALSTALTPDDAVSAVVGEGTTALGAQEGLVCLLSADGDALEIVGSVGLPTGVAETFRSFPVAAALPASEVVRSGQPAYFSARQEIIERYPLLATDTSRSRIEAWMMLPLVVKGRTLGAMVFGFAERRTFTVDERAFAEALANQCAQALERTRLYEEAESANKAKASFLAAVSHDLRQPLNASLGFLDLLLMGLPGSLSEAQREHLERIRRNQRYLLALINDVLSFARIEAGQLQLRRERVPVSDVLHALPELIDPQASAKGVSVSYDQPDRGLSVLGDRERVLQVCTNLLTNAIKATSAGGSITVRVELASTRVRISVTDTGVGIPEEMLERIFEPFTQVSRALNRPGEGVGLGLSISRDLAQRMGGTLAVESEVGKGSTFTLELPGA